MCCEKGGLHGRQTCIIDVEKVVSLQRCIFPIGQLGIYKYYIRYSLY